MLAFDMEAKKLVFLRDYWRGDVDGTEKEGDSIHALLDFEGCSKYCTFWKGKKTSAII
jgi:hypothetical protein